MSNSIETFKRSILHLNRNWNHWYYWSLITSIHHQYHLRKPRRLTFLYRNRVRPSGFEFVSTGIEFGRTGTNSNHVPANSVSASRTRFLWKKVSLCGFRKHITDIYISIVFADYFARRYYNKCENAICLHHTYQMIMAKLIVTVIVIYL